MENNHGKNIRIVGMVAGMGSGKSFPFRISFPAYNGMILTGLTKVTFF